MSLSSKQKRTIATVVAVIFIFSVVGFAAVSVLRREQPADVMATVNEQTITKRDVDVWVSLFTVLYGPDVDDVETREGILTQVIEETLLVQAAQERQLETDAAEVETAADQLWTALGLRAGGVDQLETALGKYGVGKSDVQGLVQRSLLIERLYEKLVAEVAITDEEARSHYDSYPGRYLVPASVRARHILVDTEEEAKALLAQLAEGADFSALAEEHSQDTWSATDGGDLGFFQRGMMVPEFDAAAFALDIGEVSELVATTYGYHIILVEERTEERQRSYAEVESDIKTDLTREKGERLFADFLDQLLAAASIR